MKLEILSPQTGQVIGHGRYTVQHLTAGAVLRGENRYLDGSYDIEEVRMGVEPERAVPVMVRFKHTFYRADGSIEREGRADMRTGVGWCETSQNGRQKIKSAQFNFPADTYAGASILIPIQDYLEHGDTQTPLHLHAFNCVPGPKLLLIEVDRKSEDHWSHYPGRLVGADVTADFGLWNLLIKPFIPKITAWFDPADGWNFAGGNLERYYRGPQITLVKTH